MVTDNMDSAFRMAKAASTAIQLAIDGSEESNSKNEDVLKWMFLKKNESVKNNKKLKAAKGKCSARERRGYCLTFTKMYMTMLWVRINHSQQIPKKSCLTL